MLISIFLENPASANRKDGLILYQSTATINKSILERYNVNVEKKVVISHN